MWLRGDRGPGDWHLSQPWRPEVCSGRWTGSLLLNPIWRPVTVPIDRRMDGENMVFIPSGVLLSHEKEGNHAGQWKQLETVTVRERSRTPNVKVGTLDVFSRPHEATER